MKEISMEKFQFTQEDREKAASIKENLDLMDSQACLQFGTAAQRSIAEFTDQILSQARAKDSGYVGELLGELLAELKEVDVTDPGNDEGFLAKIPFLKSAKNKAEKLISRYEVLKVQVDRIEAKLEQARMEMLKDIGMFDMMYEKNLEYFRNLNLYIAAGEEKIEELQREELPRLRKEAADSGDPMAAQLVHDFEENAGRFEKKIHDLKLSRTIAIQTAPQIKLIQNNDKLLADKIQTAIQETIPLWKSQMVMALGLYRQQEALRLQRNVTETTNAMLLKNSEKLKQNTLDVAKESERGIVDIETLEKANQNLISTINEAVRIQKEGHEKRAAAEQELLKIESEIRRTLIGAGSQSQT